MVLVEMKEVDEKFTVSNFCRGDIQAGKKVGRNVGGWMGR